MKNFISLSILLIACLTFLSVAHSSDWEKCGIKPPPPIGYSSSDAVCEVKDGKGEWKFIKRSSYRCGIKPPPPIGMSADSAVCQCDAKGKKCKWIFLSK